MRRRTGGRSARVRESVLRSALDVLLEQGLDALTFSEISRRAGVHATSVQRRWRTRENVLLEALVMYASDAIKVPDTGSLRGDLIAMSEALGEYLSSSLGQSILQVLISSVEHDPLFEANRSEFVRIRMDVMRAMMTRAAARGELRPGLDEQIALDLALGPLYVRTLITRQPVDSPFIEGFVDTLMRGLVP